MTINLVEGIGMPNVIRSLVSKVTSRRLRAGVAALLITASVGAAALLPTQPVAAQAVDSAVVININGYSGSVNFHTTSHSIGNCNTPENKNFSVTSSRVCSGFQIGPPGGLHLYVSNAPAGYQFNGFTVTNTPGGGGSATCSHYCYFNFSSGSATVYANFSAIPAPAPPAAPTAPSSVTAGTRTATTVQVNWSAANTPGGFHRYEVWQGNTRLKTIYDPNQRTYTQGGLTCNTAYSYYVRVYESYASRSATSGTLNTGTTACPAAAGSTTSSSSSSSTTKKKTTTSTTGNNSATNNNTQQLPATGVSSTSIEADTLAAVSDPMDEEFEEDTYEEETIPEETDDKKGLTNLEKIVIGVVALSLFGGIARYLYVRQVNKQSNYWS